jgi:LysR family glycine cleavage system transcriptional activator
LNRSCGIWDEWLALAGYGDAPPPRRLRFENFFVVLQAANDGLGVALAPLKLVAHDLEAGRLVAPFRAPTLACPPIEVLYPSPPHGNGRARAFVDWLVEQAR